MLKKVFLLFFLFSNVAHAKSVILMIGDGMGYNHISCVAKDNDLFLAKHTANSSVITESADDIITDSAAAATAYACGIKTKNRFLGIDAQKNKCETIAEKAINNNKNVFIISTDNEYGATPSAFYVHADDRDDHEAIDKGRKIAQNKMHLRLNVKSLEKEVDRLIIDLDNIKNDYFVMIEAAKIDKASHLNDFDEMAKQLVDFDKSIEKMVKFAENKNVLVIVTADHETGGLLDSCKYLTNNHTMLNVPVYLYGTNYIINEEIDNTEIHEIIEDSLFQ